MASRRGHGFKVATRAVVCCFGLVLAVSAATGAASAASIALDSGAGLPFTSTGTGGDCLASGSTVTITPVSAWASALPGSAWISCAQTGNNGVSIPNGAIVTINEAFTVPTGEAGTGGTVDVFADDTAAVYLDGTQLIAPDLAPGSTCAPGIIGCTTPHMGVITLPSGLTGANTFTVAFYQTNGDGSGTDWAGSYTLDPSPEPGSLALLGPGMVGLAWFVRRRKVQGRQDTV